MVTNKRHANRAHEFKAKVNDCCWLLLHFDTAALHCTSRSRGCKVGQPGPCSWISYSDSIANRYLHLSFDSEVWDVTFLQVLLPACAGVWVPAKISDVMSMIDVNPESNVLSSELSSGPARLKLLDGSWVLLIGSAHFPSLFLALACCRLPMWNVEWIIISPSPSPQVQSCTTNPESWLMIQQRRVRVREERSVVGAWAGAGSMIWWYEN